jgi:hypothetical protein
MRPDSKSPYRLLVEGIDDMHSIVHLLQRHGFDWNDDATPKPFVEVAQGVNSLLEALPTALKTYRRVGVVLDADVDPLTRWQAICDRTRLAGVPLPSMPVADGTVVPSTQPSWKCGVWLMPNNTAGGALEDFLALLVPHGDPCWGTRKRRPSKLVAAERRSRRRTI